MNLMDLHYPTHTQKMTFHKQTCVLLVSLTCNACVRLMRWRVDKHGDMFAEQLQKTSKAGVSTRQYWPGTLKTVRARLSNTLAHARVRNAWNVCCLVCPLAPSPPHPKTNHHIVCIYLCMYYTGIWSVGACRVCDTHTTARDTPCGFGHSRYTHWLWCFPASPHRNANVRSIFHSLRVHRIAPFRNTAYGRTVWSAIFGACAPTAANRNEATVCDYNYVSIY